MISGSCREVAENCALLGHYAASSGNLLPGTVRKYHCSLRNKPEERSSPVEGTTQEIFKNKKRTPSPVLEAKLRIHIITAQGALKFGREVCGLKDIDGSSTIGICKIFVMNS
jgi:hypothetical protein